MKMKKFLSLLLAGIIAVSTLSFNVIANTVEPMNILNDSVESSGAVDFKSPQVFKFGSFQTEFIPGEYNIPVSLMKSSDITSPSMAGSCIKGGVLNVKEDGNAQLTVDLQPVSVFGLTDWAENWKIYLTNDLKSEPVAAQFTTNADGKVDSITFDIPDVSADGVYVNMFISAMQANQDAYIAIDYSNFKEETKIYTGTYHVEQFGEYDVNVSVSVNGGIITGIEVEGTNFGGTYADFNKSKLQTAVDGLKDLFMGKSSNDANGINGIDAVTSATISSNAIKNAVLNALSLAIEEEVINIPKEKLAQGQYTVDISYCTDNVKHSLVEKDKIQAVLNVDAGGNLSLTSDIINGTVKEPLYVLDFNGYYADNDVSKEILNDDKVSVKKDTTDYSDDVFAKDTQVVTEVTYPLVGDYAKVYNTDAKIYVPAMKNLQGEVAGVYFDNGVFNTNCFTTVYWDSLKKVKEPVIIADGAYTADISILKIDSDDVSSAQRSFNTTAVPIEVKNGKAYVRLAYTSPMIEKIEQLVDGSYVELEKTVTEDGNYVEVELDNIADIGTIQFTINTGTVYGTMVNQARVKVNIDTLKESQNTPSYEYGSNNVLLEPNTYTVPVMLMNANNITIPSMAGSCIKGAELIVNEDGTVTVKVDLTAVAVGTISDWAEKWNIYQGNAASGEVKPAIESINNDGKVESIMFILPDNSFDGVYVNMFVPVMNYSPDAYLAIDFANAKINGEETTESTTETATENSTEITTKSTTLGTTEITTDSSTEITTESITEITTDSPTEITTESTTETATETTTENTTETATEDTTEVPAKAVKYSVPIKMVQAANPSLDSMGNGAIDGNAIVTVKDGKSTVELNFKAYSLNGLYGHLLNLWSYPQTDNMDYSWWNDHDYEIPANIVKTYDDYGMDYIIGDTTQSKFVKTISIDRNAEKENSIYVRISVDAMAGFDQAARLDFDWDNAKVITEIENPSDSSTEVSTETSTEISTEETTESSTESFSEYTTEKSNNGGGSSSDETQDGKYWMNIALWNANIDQASMGDSAFDNNRKALVTISGNTARIEIASNPVAVSGYTSALQDIRSDDVSINVDARDSFTTNTRFDGSEHIFDYITRFSFNLDDITTEYIPVEISVPYTPMDGISANVGNYIAARLKLDWNNLEKADSNATLNPDSSSAAGSSSGGGGGSSVSTDNKETGIKVEADEFVFENGVEFLSKLIKDGDEYKAADELIENEFRLYSVSAEKDGQSVNPNGVAKVYIPVEKEDSENVAIYRIVNGDKNTELGKTLLEHELSEDGKYYVITVKEFGLFAVEKSAVVNVEEPTEQKETEVTDNSDNSTVFNDILGHWAYDNILKAVEFGLFNGVEDDRFAPDMPTTRAMFVTVLGRLNGVSTDYSGEITFTDVNSDDYFYPYVVWASENGIVSGIGETTFAPNENITREQMARILYEYAKNQGIEFKEVEKTEFTDAETISSWAEESVNILSHAAVINGRVDGTFDPKGNATRAEIATMFVRFVDNYMISDSEQ